MGSFVIHLIKIHRVQPWPDRPGQKPLRTISSALCNLSLWALWLWSHSDPSNLRLQHVISRFLRWIAFFSILNPLCIGNWDMSSLHSFLLLLLLSPLASPRDPFREVTAFLGDGIIFILFMVQRKSVVRREEWTETSKARQRFWWSFRTAVSKAEKPALLLYLFPS